MIFECMQMSMFNFRHIFSSARTLEAIIIYLKEFFVIIFVPKQLKFDNDLIIYSIGWSYWSAWLKKLSSI